MPYFVTGWVETTYIPPEERDPDLSMWMPLLSLHAFNLAGDVISQYLFGLGKMRMAGLYENRGIPRDSCSTVLRDFEENEAFVRRVGEGDFGHTHATLDEIRAALSLAGAPALDESAEWAHAIASAEYAARAPNVGAPSFCRFIVWANW